MDAIEGLYSFRRILPTLAHKSEFDTTERLDVGGWTDAKDKSRASMPSLYSAANLHMQNTRKSEAIYMARSAHAQFVGLEQDGECCLDPTWEQLFPFWPCRDKKSAKEHISKSMSSRKSPAAFGEKQRDGASCGVVVLSEKVVSTTGATSSPPKAVKSAEKSQSESDGESSEELFGSSSSEIGSQEANDDLDALDEPYPHEFTQIQFQISTGKKGCVHFINPKTGTLFCGRTLRLLDTGAGLSEASQAQRPASPRCLAALSPQARAWWKESV